MVQPFQVRDVKRSERAKPNSERRGFKGLLPQLHEPPSGLRGMLSSALARARGLRKAVESPDAALKRAAAEPIDQDVLMAPYKGRAMRTKH